MLTWSTQVAFWCRCCYFQGMWRLSGRQWRWHPLWICWFWIQTDEDPVWLGCSLWCAGEPVSQSASSEWGWGVRVTGPQDSSGLDSADFLSPRTMVSWPALYVKCHEMTFVMIWHYINKTELNWLSWSRCEHSPVTVTDDSNVIRPSGFTHVLFQQDSSYIQSGYRQRPKATK